MSLSRTSSRRRAPQTGDSEEGQRGKHISECDLNDLTKSCRRTIFLGGGWGSEKPSRRSPSSHRPNTAKTFEIKLIHTDDFAWMFGGCDHGWTFSSSRSCATAATGPVSQSGREGGRETGLLGGRIFPQRHFRNEMVISLLIDFKKGDQLGGWVVNGEYSFLLFSSRCELAVQSARAC